MPFQDRIEGGVFVPCTSDTSREVCSIISRKVRCKVTVSAFASEVDYYVVLTLLLGGALIAYITSDPFIS